MIEKETLIQWARELTALANGVLSTNSDSPFTEPDIDLSDFEAHRLPEDALSVAEGSAMKLLAERNLALLAEWQRSKRPSVPDKLVRAAKRWLDHDLVRSTHPAYNLTPMDGLLSLSREGQLQVIPRFRSEAAKFAVTFAELIQPDAPAFVKRCGCGKFFIHERRARGQPRKLCDAHYELSKKNHRGTPK
jgi:hypothetical protein